MERIGKYEVLGLLGRGGMGAVYRARDPVLGRDVAIKVILDRVTDAPSIRERFYREARRAAALSHENITTVYDFGEEEGRPYLVMELLDGSDLRRVLHAPPSLPARLDIAVQTCQGLDYAHGRGLIHRDVKPENVQVTSRGRVKILDFGIARVQSEQTLTQANIGTPRYMSPEQIREEPVDHRTDIFSFGVLLYELLSGVNPFAGDHVTAVIFKVLNQEPAPLQLTDPVAKRALQRVVAQCLAKSRQNRYGSFEEVAEALRQAQDALADGTGDPPRKLPSAKPSLFRWPRRDSTRALDLPLSEQDTTARVGAAQAEPGPEGAPPPSPLVARGIGAAPSPETGATVVAERRGTTTGLDLFAGLDLEASSPPTTSERPPAFELEAAAEVAVPEDVTEEPPTTPGAAANEETVVIPGAPATADPRADAAAAPDAAPAPDEPATPEGQSEAAPSGPLPPGPAEPPDLTVVLSPTVAIPRPPPTDATVALPPAPLQAPIKPPIPRESAVPAVRAPTPERPRENHPPTPAKPHQGGLPSRRMLIAAGLALGLVGLGTAVVLNWGDGAESGGGAVDTTSPDPDLAQFRAAAVHQRGQMAVQKDSAVAAGVEAAPEFQRASLREREAEDAFRRGDGPGFQLAARAYLDAAGLYAGAVGAEPLRQRAAQAEQDALQARGLAAGSSSDPTIAPFFRRADAAYGAAGQASDAGNVEEAARLFTEAARGFREAKRLLDQQARVRTDADQRGRAEDVRVNAARARDRWRQAMPPTGETRDSRRAEEQWSRGNTHFGRGNFAGAASAFGQAERLFMTAVAGVPIRPQGLRIVPPADTAEAVPRGAASTGSGSDSYPRP